MPADSLGVWNGRRDAEKKFGCVPGSPDVAHLDGKASRWFGSEYIFPDAIEDRSTFLQTFHIHPDLNDVGERRSDRFECRTQDAKCLSSLLFGVLDNPLRLEIKTANSGQKDKAIGDDALRNRTLVL